MEYRKFGGVIVARLDPGEEILEEVRRSPHPSRSLAHTQALGAVSDLTVGVFDVGKKGVPRQQPRQFEIVSLTGTIGHHER